ncbi:hypothetical protein ACIGGF_01275 [Rhodococcus sp. NPDC078407]|uniref:hypothetical protein n=1 Tax=Rhodococcus sp. NPDC078407 TaxID=3364509 RepID=UPI0037CCB0F0
MPTITPKFPVATGTKEQHAEMARIALAKVYEHAPYTAEVDCDFWLQVAGLHSFLSGPAD